MASLSDVPVIGDSLKLLAPCGKLRVVELSGPGIDDEVLTHLPQHASLERVYLRGTAIGDRGVAHLAVLPNLKVLTIDGTLVTDACTHSLCEI